VTPTLPALSAGRPAADAARRAWREAFVVPAIFLTVIVGGGFSQSSDGAFRFVGPLLVHLVLAVMALAVLVRSGAIVPAALMNATRTPLENATGASVLATQLVATAQALNAVTPDAGLLHVVFVVFFGLLFWNTLAVEPDATRARRSLLLVFGAALVARHVVLAAFYSPDPSLTKRVLQALLEGVTLGSVHYAPTSPATGYVAFATLVLYFVGLSLLPSRTLAEHGRHLLRHESHDDGPDDRSL
jgi:hypothetical protein